MMLFLFELTGQKYALPMGVVKQVLDPVPVTPLPFVPPEVEGLVNVSGRVIPQIDLKTKLFGPTTLEDQEQRPRNQILILLLGQNFYALRIEKVIGMKEKDQEADPPPPTQEAGIEEQTQGPSTKMILDEVMVEGDPVLLLDHQELEIAGSLDLNLPQGKGALIGLADKSKEQQNRQSVEQSFAVLALQVDQERYALPLHRILEIIEIETLVHLPKAPAQIAGVVSLRNEPVLALSLRSLLGKSARQDQHCKLVLIEHQGERLGLLTNLVLGIENFAESQRRPLHQPQDGLACYLLGQEGKMLGYLDIENLLPPELWKILHAYLPQGDQDQEEEMEEERGHYLMFLVGQEQYGLPMEQVRRVVEFVPFEHDINEEQNPWFHGVAQFQGQIMPVVDLRLVFEQATETGPFTSYLIVQHQGELCALLVDRVFRVADIPMSQVDQVGRGEDGLVTAIGRKGDCLFSILDSARVFIQVPS